MLGFRGDPIMRCLQKLLTLTAVLSASSFLLHGQASAQGSVWDHNGSLMRLEENAKKRKFIYEEPRRSLNAAGVKTGTVLFDGEEKSDGRLAGYAKLFRKGCDPVDYFVEGPYHKGKGEILLQGQAPIYSGNGCKITGYSDDGSASSLKFTLLDAPESTVASAPDGIEQGDGGEPRPSYLPPLSLGQTERNTPRPRERAERDTAEQAQPAYRNRRSPGREEATSEPSDSSRNYASRRYRERFGENSRHDGSYYSEPAYREEPDTYDEYDDDYYDEPAYVPYQPRWRRYRY
jgi:hypothetical protein